MTDFTAYIGEPSAAKVARVIDEMAAEDGIGWNPNPGPIIAAVLASMETVTLSEVWGKESSPGSIHKVEWIAEYIGDSRASHRRLVGPWEPVEE